MMGSQCVRSDGRSWRCPHRALVSHNLCEHHYRQKLEYRSNDRRRRTQEHKSNTSSYLEDGKKKSSLVANSSDDVSEKDCGKGKEITVEKQVGTCLNYHDAVPKNEGNQTAKKCVYFDEMGRCRKQARAGNDSCEYHLRLKKMILANKRKDKNVSDQVCDQKRSLKEEGKEAKKQVNGCSKFNNHVGNGSKRRLYKKLVDINLLNDVVENDRVDTDVSCAHERISKVSRCTRTDGKRWRCRQQALVGYNRCERHLSLKSIRMVNGKYKNDVVVKDLANSKVSNGAESITQDSQCTHTDGKLWRCRQHVLVGYNLCEHHLVQDQNSMSKNVDATSDREDENEKAQLVAAKRRQSENADIAEDSRCKCTDGMGWRCSQQVRVGYNFCEHHFGKRRLC